MAYWIRVRCVWNTRIICFSCNWNVLQYKILVFPYASRVSDGNVAITLGWLECRYETKENHGLLTMFYDVLLILDHNLHSQVLYKLVKCNQLALWFLCTKVSITLHSCCIFVGVTAIKNTSNVIREMCLTSVTEEK